MKKFVAVLSAAAMMTTLAACGSTADTTASSAAAEATASAAESTADTAAKSYKVAIVQQLDHASLDEIRVAIEAELDAKAAEKGIAIEYKDFNGQNDATTLNQIGTQVVSDGYDAVIPIATLAAQCMTTACESTKTPVIYAAISDPAAADLTDIDYVTGTSDAIPVDQVMQLCQELTPEVQKIGFLYTTSEINAQVTTEQAMEAAEQMGYETQLMTISEVSELQQAAQSLAQEVDAIYVPIDNTIAQAMPVLAQVGIDFQIPIYTGADSMVQDGGFATVGINYTQLGQKTAEMAAAVLEGTPISELPVETLSEFGTYINQTTAEQIGVEIPQEIAETATILS